MQPLAAVSRFQHESMIHSGEIQVLEGLRGPQPSYGDDEQTTFLHRPGVFAPRSGRGSDSDARTVVAPRPGARSGAAPKSAPGPWSPSARPAAAPTWSAAKSAVAPRAPAFVEEIREETGFGSRAVPQLREATGVALVMPNVVRRDFDSREFKARELEARERELEVREIEARALEAARLGARERELERREQALVRKEREASKPPPRPAAPVEARPAPPPLPQPRLQEDRADTMRPVALEPTAAAAREPTVRTRPPSPALHARRSRVGLAASLGMVAAIFSLGIALGAVAFGRARAERAAAAATVAAAPQRLALPPPMPPKEEPKPAAVAEALKPEAPKSDPPRTDAPKPIDTKTTAAATARPWGQETKPDDAKMARADEPKPKKRRTHATSGAVSAPEKSAVASAAPAAKKAPGTGDDVDAANEADALARAQLEASLR